MILPKFDPWQSLSTPQGCAYRAYRAYPAPTLGTSDTLGTQANAPFVISGTKLTAPFSSCMRHARGTSAGSPSPREAFANKVHSAAQELCRSPWIGQLTRMGWDGVALFSFDASGRDLGGLAQSLVGGRLILATPTTAYLRVDGRISEHHRSRASQRKLSLIFDVMGYVLDPTVNAHEIIGDAKPDRSSVRTTT